MDNNKKTSEVWLKLTTKCAYWKANAVAKWDELNPQQKKIFKLLVGGSGIIVILSIALIIYASIHKKPIVQNNVSKSTVTQQQKQTVANKELAKQNIDLKNNNKDVKQVDISPTKDISIDTNMLTKNYQAENVKLKQQVAELMASKENLATKEDIKTLVSMINQNYSSNVELISQAQKSNDSQIQSILEKINKLDGDLHKVMKDSLITVVNNDFTVSSIIWVNGTQLLNIQDLALDKNITLKQGQTYKGWDLVSIDNHNCAVFKNSEGINKQCI